MEIIAIFAWAAVSLAVAFASIDRKLGFFGGLMLSLILSPLFGAIISLMTPHEVETEILAELKKLNAQKAADEAA